MVDYNNFAKTFSKSRKNLKWPEIDYFIQYISSNFKSKINILDIWCGNWRILKTLNNSWLEFSYLWTDSSEWMINEAKILFPENKFQTLDMLNMDKIWQKFDIIFFIASFHHLQTIEDRLNVLNKAKNLLNDWWIIMMTNWNLLWEMNFIKYKDSYIWNGDFNIKIGNFKRYYHSFGLDELSKLFDLSGFETIKNEFFDDENNSLSIIK